MSQLYEAHNDIVSLLPVKIYRHNLEGNYIYSPLHFHRSIELTVTLTGNIRFNSGSNNFDFKESDWLLINSCELHSCRYIAPSDSFTMDPLSDTYNFLLMSKIYEILALFSVGCIKKDVSYSIPSRQEIHLATSYADYIEKHYQEDISLTDVAEHFQYTSSYFSRHFKETLGVNFLSYLSIVRVGHAAEQLANGQENLTTCAFDNGFPNIKSFINTFKKMYGCTPGVFLTSLKD